VHFIYPLFYTVSDNEIKKEQRYKIKNAPGDALTSLSLERPFFILHYNSAEKELSYNGKMYDIAGVNYMGNKVVCTVLQDEKESELVENFTKNILHNHPDKTSKQCISWSPSVQPIYYKYSPIAHHYYEKASFSLPMIRTLSAGFKSKLNKPPCYQHVA